MEKNGVIMSKSISCPRIAYPDGCDSVVFIVFILLTLIAVR
jgi:hypothetical protein